MTDNPDAPAMSPLQALILDRMAQKGWDAKQVEARGVSHATLWRYMNPVTLKQLPRQAIIAALAKGLDLPEQTVLQAAKDSVAGQVVSFKALKDYDLGRFKVYVTVERQDGASPTTRDVNAALRLLTGRLQEGTDGPTTVVRPFTAPPASRPTPPPLRPLPFEPTLEVILDGEGVPDLAVVRSGQTRRRPPNDR